MNHSELLQAAETAHPDYFAKTASVLKMLSEVHPVFADEMKEEMAVVLNTASSGLEKVAAKGGMPPGATNTGIKGFGRDVGAAVAGAIGLSIASDLYGAARRGFTKSRNLKKIMEYDPSLKELDKKRLQSSFSTLHRFSPELTSDPLLGASILRELSNMPAGNESQYVKDLIGMQKNLTDINDKNLKVQAPNRFQPNQIEMTKLKSDHLLHELDRGDAIRSLQEQGITEAGIGQYLQRRELAFNTGTYPDRDKRNNRSEREPGHEY